MSNQIKNEILVWLQIICDLPFRIRHCVALKITHINGLKYRDTLVITTTPHPQPTLPPSTLGRTCSNKI